MLEVDNVYLRFGQVEALSGVSLSVTSGEVVALVGSSGSGKSSLLYCMSGLLSPTGGSVRLNGVNLGALDREGRATLRREKIGFVFQFSELVPELTLRENIALPLELIGARRSLVRERVQELLDALALADRADARPAQVSGGEAQRAAVARAIVHSPSIIFADEPTGALDSKNGEAVLNALLSLAQSHGTSVVLVTHDESVARRADRLVTLADGAVVADRVRAPSAVAP
ncbi:MAG: ABC transporter ATP-binding protein [Chloroflexota bacterium]|nr:ABC transporter ATP-binding protein [Chloroflexota bacterium]